MKYLVPGYLAPYILTGMITIITTVLLGLRRALRRAAWTEKDRAKAFWSVALLLAGWFIFAAATSTAGWYRPASGPPTIQYGLLIPIVVGAVLFRVSPLVRRTLAIIPDTWLVGVQVYRVLGVIFLVLYAGGHLSALFALPAGLGDTLVGIFAPFVAASFARSSEGSSARVRVWNWLGITDLVVAVTLGFVTSPSPLQLASFDRPSGLIAMFPLSLIPVFAVPFSILLHLASLRRLSQRDEAGITEQRTPQIASTGGLKRKVAIQQ